jgi:hypothetical protein
VVRLVGLLDVGEGLGLGRRAGLAGLARFGDAFELLLVFMRDIANLIEL